MSGWQGARVLVTGHTGFKGAWLSLWLRRLGAEVIGLANGVPTTPSLYAAARVGDMVEEHIVDVRDVARVADVVRSSLPDVVFHLAAQSLVRASYAEPRATWDVNVGGTVNLLEACRSTASVAAIVVVTSDKCYENRGDGRPHREGDPLGGHDPYSASKAAAEIVAASWRASYFADGPPMATVRAGNVIGSGDWSADRLVPDFVRAATGVAPLRIRNPAAVRPWQDVLDCLAGYLLVAERLRAGDNGASRAWNFGPSPEAARDVGSVVARLVELWPNTVAWRADDGPNPPEAPLLMLDSTDARTLLGWRPRSSLDESLADLVAWHVSHAAGEDVLPLCEKLLDRRSERA